MDQTPCTNFRTGFCAETGAGCGLVRHLAADGPGTFRHTSSCSRNLSGRSPSILLRKTVLSLKSPTGAFIVLLRSTNANCKFLYYHIFKTCFAFALTNWIIGPEMITVISVHTPNFPPNKTPVTTTKISNAIRTNLICQ